ncbi:MAG: hypothetical protein WBG86_09605, partial [Polyangiales bacterium]
MFSPAVARFWSPMLAIVLIPALLQDDCGMVRTWNLSTLEVEAAGLDRVVGFDEFVNAYDVWTTTGVDTIVVRAESLAKSADVSYELSFGGPVTSGDLGVGGGEATLDIPPDTAGLLRIGVRVGGITTFHEVRINPPCGVVTCNDANPCTSDVCNVSACEFTAVANGASCPIALSDCNEGSGAGAGTCQTGLCTAALEVCPCDADTAYQALTKECASGKVYDPEATTCTCEELGADVPEGGSCAQFGPPVVAGCEMPGGVLNSQLAFNTFIFFGVTSPGAGGPGTVDHRARVLLDSTIFNVAGALEQIDSVTVVIASDPPGTPPTLVN